MSNPFSEFVWEPFVNLFRRKRILTAYIFDSEGDFKVVRRKVKEHKFEFANGFYSVKKDRIYYNKRTQKQTSFYFLSNPEPLDLSHIKHFALSAEALKEMVKSDMVKDIYVTEKNTDMLLIILIALVGLISLINLLIALKVIKVGS